MTPRRAIFGGSFDPVHFGHLWVAEALCDLERLDEVVFVPAARSPHKSHVHASGAQRLAMLRLAVRDNRRFRISDVELRRGAPSYTIDTVRTLHAAWGARPWLVLGGDSLLELHTWREARALLRETRILVFARPGATEAAARARALGVRYHAEVVSPLSSQAIRAHARSGHSVRYLVPEAVRRYIEREQLYAGSRRRRT